MCVLCKIINILASVVAVVVAVVSVIALYKVLFVLSNRIGTTDGSLAILAAVFAFGMLKKVTKNCGFCKRGCGCGNANCDCGSGCACGKGGCDCGHDHGDASMPHQH